MSTAAGRSQKGTGRRLRASGCTRGGDIDTVHTVALWDARYTQHMVVRSMYRIAEAAPRTGRRAGVPQQTCQRRRATVMISETFPEASDSPYLHTLIDHVMSWALGVPKGDHNVASTAILSSVSHDLRRVMFDYRSFAVLRDCSPN